MTKSTTEGSWRLFLSIAMSIKKPCSALSTVPACRNLFFLLTCLFAFFCQQSWSATELEWDVSKIWSNYHYDKAGNTYNLKLKNRTFTKDAWDIVCFPFDASKSDMDNVFVDGYELQELTSIDGNKFVFTKVAEFTSLTAGKPYLFKSNSTLSDPVFADVKLTYVTDAGEQSITFQAESATHFFKGQLFLKYIEDLDNKGSADAYLLTSAGTLAKAEYVAGGYQAISGYFQVPKNTVPSITIDGFTPSGGGTGGGSDYYTSRTQRNPCVPTVYIDIFDCVKNNSGSKPLEGTGDAKGTYQIYLSDGSTITVSDALIAENKELTAGARDDRFKNYYQNANATKEESYDLARIQIIDASGSIKQRDELTTIRGRGNSTWGSQKRAFRLKFPSKTKLLSKADGTNNYANAKSWTLIANAADHALIRNALSSELGGYVGMPFNVAYKFVDLVINGEYYGSYHIGDHIQVAPKRVDIDEDKGWFFELVGGNQKDGHSPFAEDPFFTVTASLPGNATSTVDINVKNPEVAGDNSDDPVIADIKQWFTDNLGSSIGKPDETTGYRNFIDINSLANYVIVDELTGNYDGTVSNYMYKDATDRKLKFGPIWDNDLSYDNYSDEYNSANLLFEPYDHYAPANSIISSIFNDPVFLQVLNERWNHVYGTETDGVKAFLLNKVDELVNSISCSAADNNNKWGTNSNLVNGIATRNYSSYDDAVQTIKNFIPQRVSFLNTKFHDLLTAKKGASEFSIDATADTAPDFAATKSKVTENYVEVTRPAVVGTVKVLNRTFAANEWTTLCLPFYVTDIVLKEKFGSQVELREYTGIDESGNMLFTTKAQPNVEAGIPYLIKPTETVANPTFSNVVICVDEPREVKINADDEWSFCGTFNQITTDNTQLCFNSASGQFALNEATALIGLSAYVKGPANTTEVMPLDPSAVPTVNYDVTLTDATTRYAAYNGQTVNVNLLNRGTVTHAYANPLCLPFSATAEQMEAVFGSGYVLEQFSGVDLQDEKVVVLRFSQVTPGTVEAGTPYLITPSQDVSVFNFKNVKFNATPGSTTPQSGYAYVALLNQQSFGKFSADSPELFVGKNNKFVRLGSAATLTATRAYFTVPSSVASREFGYFQDDDVISGIDRVVQVAHEGLLKVYNLNGQLMSGSLSDLPGGIYLVNGKKIVK